MELAHNFTVPVSIDAVWEHFKDIGTVAECFPGAAVTSVDGDTFSGSCKVKLGPIALVYNGSGTFVERDEAAHTFKVEAKGKDKRGNGTAGANVDLSMTAAGSSTDIQVLTSLAITGKPAQFGRGVMQDVSDKLLGQFVSCLEQRFAAPSSDEPESLVEPVERRPEPVEGTTPPKHKLPPPPAQDDALDLGATVLPILLKSYWKQGFLGLLGFLLVIRVLRGRGSGD